MHRHMHRDTLARRSLASMLFFTTMRRALRGRPAGSSSALFLSVLSLAILLTAAVAEAKGPEIYPLSQVKAGQKGYGLTAFKGSTPEKFEFEVIGVVHNFLPKMDIVLVKSADDKLKVSGFAQGMSGSPLFIDGKVMCAFSYGFRFNKEAIGGCTPLQYMLDDAKTPLRGPEATAMASTDEWARVSPMELIAAAGGATTDGAEERVATRQWLFQAPLPTAPAVDDGDENGLIRAGVPLSVSGLGPNAMDRARAVFAPYGMEPMQAGGAGDAKAGPTKFEMGAPIGVMLAAGDVSANGTGTVSYVDGKTVLGFGHPMFQIGESYMPISTADIHIVIPSAQSAFKLSSPGRVLGSLVQDRQSMIMGDTAKKSEMIPVDIKVKGQNGAKEFHSEVVRNRYLTPNLVMLAVDSATQLLAPDLTDATITIVSTIQVKGYKPLSFTDYLFSSEGANTNTVASARGLRVLVPLLFNPWAPITIEKIAIDVDIAYKANVVSVQAARLPDYELPYGEKTWVEVQLLPYKGKPYWEKIPISIPEKYAGQVLRVEIVPGDSARPDVAPPENMDQVMAALRKTYPGNTIVATIYVPDEGVTMNGQIVPDLPDSAIDTVRPSTSTSRGEGYRSLLRVVVPAKTVMQGGASIVFKVADKK